MKMLAFSWMTALRSTLFFILTVASVVRAAPSVRVWPFDQRQIVLVKKAAQSFTDDRTTAIIMDVFVKQGRVRWLTQRAGKGQVLPVEVPADFPWQSAQSVRNLGLKLKADGILVLSQKGVKIDLSWFATADGQPLFYESIALPDSNKSPEQEEVRRKRLVEWLDDIWARIPGVGYVIKRDLKTITLEGAPQLGLKIGDPVRLKRLDKLERHLILKTVIGMSSSVTGTAEIIKVEGPFATAEVKYESKIDPIEAGDRYEVLGISSAKPGAAALIEKSNSEAELKTMDRGESRRFLPFFGESSSAEDSNGQADGEHSGPKYKVLDVSALATYGKVSHSDTLEGEADPKEMTASTPGFRLNLKGYVTREVLLLTDVDFNYLKFSGQSTNYGTNTIASGITAYRLAGAYRYIFLDTEYATGEVNFHFGFRRFGLAMGTTSANDTPLAKSYSGWDLGASIVLPVVDRYSGFFKFSKTMWAKLAETPKTSGEGSTNNVWQFEVGGKYRMNPTTELMAGIVFDSATTSFTGAGTRDVASTAFELGSTLYQVGATFKY